LGDFSLEGALAYFDFLASNGLGLWTVEKGLIRAMRLAVSPGVDGARQVHFDAEVWQKQFVDFTVLILKQF
jgi:hypothetical protein